MPIGLEEVITIKRRAVLPGDMSNIIAIDKRLRDKIKSGDKKTLLRPGIEDFRLGFACFLTPSEFKNRSSVHDGAFVNIESIEIVKLKDITLIHANSEFYNTSEDIKEAIQDTFPETVEQTPLTFIRFKLLSTDELLVINDIVKKARA